MKIINDIRITKQGLQRLNVLLSSNMVDRYHKTLLTSIKNNMPKNLSKSDCDIFATISEQYRGL